MVKQSSYCRCYAALGDVSKSRYLREVGRLAEQITRETVNTHTYTLMSFRVCLLCCQGQEGSGHYLVQARLAVLNKQFKQAEQLLMERVRWKRKKG